MRGNRFIYDNKLVGKSMSDEKKLLIKQIVKNNCNEKIIMKKIFCD